MGRVSKGIKGNRRKKGEGEERHERENGGGTSEVGRIGLAWWI